MTTAEVPLGRVGVVGGGTMGSGIVHMLLATGVETVLVENSGEMLDRALGLVKTSLEGAERRGKLTSTPADLLQRLSATTDRGRLADASLVVEAVPEVPDLKIELLCAIESVIGPDAVLASNTSSLSLTTLAERLQRPNRFLGLHFFNPVPAQPLLEIIRTGQTDQSALDRAYILARRLGKETVEVRDSPGFATSRLGVLLGLEAVRMVEEGVASAEDIDKAMVLGYRHPMGPCRLGDLVGHDVRLGIAEYLSTQLGPRFEPPQLLRDMVAAGRLGKKTGQGFYRWD